MNPTCVVIFTFPQHTKVCTFGASFYYFLVLAQSRKVASQLSVSLQVGEVKPAPSNPEKDADSGSDDYEEPLDTIKSR